MGEMGNQKEGNIIFHLQFTEEAEITEETPADSCQKWTRQTETERL